MPDPCRPYAETYAHTRIWSTFAPEFPIEAIRMVLLPSLSVAETDDVRVHVDQLPEAGNATVFGTSLRGGGCHSKSN